MTAYDLDHLSGDLVALLDHYGHDWGATVVWGLALLHPHRVNRVINLSVPYPDRGEKPWVEFIEDMLGSDFYYVHFNRHPGVADALLDENTSRFLRNVYRKAGPPSGVPLLDLALAREPLMSDGELAVYVSAFEKSGFTGGINWYRLADVNPVVHQPSLMIYAERDLVPREPNLTSFVPDVEVVTVDCGHWIQQEKPDETTRAILKWLDRRPTPPGTGSRA